MSERRSTYFIFQGLLTVILLLFFLYHKELAVESVICWIFLVSGLSGLLAFVALAPLGWLAQSKIQAALFVVDVIISSVILQWAQRPDSDLYLTYFLVILGTALTQNMLQSFIIASLATLLYAYSSLRSSSQITIGTEFWLRIPYLWIVAAFTAMLSRDSNEDRKKMELQHRERLFHMERLVVLGQISAEIAHRIKAPLTTIRVNAEVLSYQRDLPAKMKKDLVQIQQEVDHCKTILQKLLNLGRIEEIDVQRMDLRDAIQCALDTVQPQLPRQGIRLNVQGMDTPSIVQGDSVLLAEAIVAVLQNAVEAMPEGGDLELGLYWIRRGKWWRLRSKDQEMFDVVIADSGVGINPDQLETIFRPFFTTKMNQGSGLGLSAALRILDKHGGSIHAHSEGLGRGTRFTLTLPRMG
ncbi:MAG: ATP-binding protein [Elusimicrobiota bacterium]|jgi:signal transduction histidine kinase